MAGKADGQQYCCSFCGKAQTQVRKLISGGMGFIFVTNVLSFVLKF